MPEPTVTLYRPVGARELELIAGSGFRRFPPRLPEQPIFYPVCNEQYAVEIAERWNAKQSGQGFVTLFRVRADFLARHETHIVAAAARGAEVAPEIVPCASQFLQDQRDRRWRRRTTRDLKDPYINVVRRGGERFDQPSRVVLGSAAAHRLHCNHDPTAAPNDPPNFLQPSGKVRPELRTVDAESQVERTRLQVEPVRQVVDYELCSPISYRRAIA
jgi:hypothetical protein